MTGRNLVAFTSLGLALVVASGCERVLPLIANLQAMSNASPSPHPSATSNPQANPSPSPSPSPSATGQSIDVSAKVTVEATTIQTENGEMLAFKITNTTDYPVRVSVVLSDLSATTGSTVLQYEISPQEIVDVVTAYPTGTWAFSESSAVTI